MIEHQEEVLYMVRVALVENKRNGQGRHLIEFQMSDYTVVYVVLRIHIPGQDKSNMKDLKILWLGKNDMYKMSCYAKYLREALAEIAHVETYGIGWPHPDLTIGKPWRHKETDILKLVKVFKPDFIYIDLYFEWDNIPKTDIPVSIFWSDPHDRIDRYLLWVKENKPDVCLLPYWGDYPRWGMQRFRENLPEDIRLKFFPISVNVDIFKDYGYERDIDLCLLGRVSRRWLPLRTPIINHYKDSKDYKVFYRPRPKRNWRWDEKTLKKHDFVARESFAKLLARCKMWPFGCSIWKYALPKFFEGMASKTLVLSDTPASAERLHFIPDKTFVEINLDNFKEKIDYYLENEDERKKIIREGYETVLKYHTTKIRARELVDYVEKELL